MNFIFIVAWAVHVYVFMMQRVALQIARKAQERLGGSTTEIQSFLMPDWIKWVSVISMIGFYGSFIYVGIFSGIIDAVLLIFLWLGITTFIPIPHKHFIGKLNKPDEVFFNAISERLGKFSKLGIDSMDYSLVRKSMEERDTYLKELFSLVTSNKEVNTILEHSNVTDFDTFERLYSRLGLLYLGAWVNEKYLLVEIFKDPKLLTKVMSYEIANDFKKKIPNQPTDEMVELVDVVHKHIKHHSS